MSRPTLVRRKRFMSFVPASWQEPLATLEFNMLSVARVLEALRRHAPAARFFQASTSEMFGQADHSPQNLRCKDTVGGNRSDVPIQYHEIRKHPRSQFSFFLLFELRER